MLFNAKPLKDEKAAEQQRERPPEEVKVDQAITRLRKVIHAREAVSQNETLHKNQIQKLKT